MFRLPLLPPSSSTRNKMATFTSPPYSSKRKPILQFEFPSPPYIFSRTCHWSHVFPRLPPIGFPALATGLMFPALVTGLMFSRACTGLMFAACTLRRFDVFPLLPLVTRYNTSDWLTTLSTNSVILT